MKKLVVRQRKSLYNQQAVKNVIQKSTTTPFKMKRKGKHCFYITFEKAISPCSASIIAKKLGLTISYKSDVRVVLTDNYDFAVC